MVRAVFLGDPAEPHSTVETARIQTDNPSSEVDGGRSKRFFVGHGAFTFLLHQDLMNAQFSSRRLDHLGLVAGVCHDLELISTLDEVIGPTKRTISVGEAVQAMVLHGLGFVSRPLYLTPEFFEGKPVARLIAPHVRPEQLHDDCLGDALDRLFEAGLTEVFFAFSSHVLTQLDLPRMLGHLDSSSLSFHGDFSPDGPDDERAVSITHGYSKDNRPDLKQMLVQLICTAKGRLPVWFEALSGQTRDKTSFPETIEDDTVPADLFGG